MAQLIDSNAAWFESSIYYNDDETKLCLISDNKPPRQNYLKSIRFYVGAKCIFLLNNSLGKNFQQNSEMLRWPRNLLGIFFPISNVGCLCCNTRNFFNQFGNMSNKTEYSQGGCQGSGDPAILYKKEVILNCTAGSGSAHQNGSDLKDGQYWVMAVSSTCQLDQRLQAEAFYSLPVLWTDLSAAEYQYYCSTNLRSITELKRSCRSNFQSVF